LFYLLARGIDRKTARALLKWAFLGDVLRAIDLPQAAPRRRAWRRRSTAGRDGNRSTDMSTKVRGVPVGAIAAATSFDSAAVRAEFPILSRQINGKPLVYLDSAASSQRPLACCARSSTTRARCMPMCIAACTFAQPMGHRSLRKRARNRTPPFLHARSTREIVFVRGTTEAINLVAKSWGRGHLAPGDEILITYLEHHANIVPWQMICAATGARAAWPRR
jgi:cysteine desulfurase/selenocysteine lyase